MGPKCRVFDWFSFSHWGMFRLAIFTAPDWFAWGTRQDDVDDDLIEELAARRQERLGPEFEAVLFDSLWELYAR